MGMKFSICTVDRPLESTSPFPLRGSSFVASADAPDGTYENLVDGQAVEVRGGQLAGEGPVIIVAPGRSQD